MKKIILTTLLTSTVAFASSEGLSGFRPGFLNRQNATENKQEVPAGETAFVGNWTEEFNTKFGKILHTPENIVIQGCITCGENFFSGKGSSFNGYVFQEDLNLQTNSTPEAFIAAMQAAGIY